MQLAEVQYIHRALRSAVQKRQRRACCIHIFIKTFGFRIFRTRVDCQLGECPRLESKDSAAYPQCDQPSYVACPRLVGESHTSPKVAKKTSHLTPFCPKIIRDPLCSRFNECAARTSTTSQTQRSPATTPRTKTPFAPAPAPAPAPALAPT